MTFTTSTARSPSADGLLVLQILSPTKNLIYFFNSLQFTSIKKSVQSETIIFLIISRVLSLHY